MPASVGSSDPGLSTWNILTVFRGSHAHGLYVPPAEPTSIDDIDIMGICVPPISHYFGLDSYGSRGTRDYFIDSWDIVTYEVRKFVSLLLKGNPNVMSALWCDEKYVLSMSPAGALLREARKVFDGKHVYYSYTGYAHGQLQRMTHWQREGRYKTGHMGEKRRRLVEQFGYDCKNASHLIRLLHMGIEYLKSGEMHVEREKDRDMLLAIKRGDWALERVTRLSEKLFQQAEAAYNRSLLPERPNDTVVNRLCVDVVREAQKRYS